MPAQPDGHSELDVLVNPAGFVPQVQLEGVRIRRVLAFIVDYFIVALLSFGAGVGVFLLGIITLGAGWLLYAVLVPLVAIAYRLNHGRAKTGNHWHAIFRTSP